MTSGKRLIVLDLTLLYYTANTIDDICAERVRQCLLEVTDGRFPLISVSQKPIAFGANICVGEIGQSHYNCYKQIYVGTQSVLTPYVACCEDDVIYHWEHFTYRPNGNVFAYNNNLWFSEQKVFWSRSEGGMCTCIAPTELLLNTLAPRFIKYPSEPLPANKHNQKYWQEPGRFDRKYGIPDAPTEEFHTEQPVVVFNRRRSLGGKRGYKASYKLAKELAPYGGAREFWRSFWE